MGLKFGDVEIEQIIENELKITVLECLFGWLLKTNPNINPPPERVVEEISRSTLKELQEKYPNSRLLLELMNR